MLLKGGGESGAVATPIHGQGSPGRHSVVVCGGNHQGTELAQFLLQQACGPVAREGPKTVAANQLSEFTAVVGGRLAAWPHFHQGDGYASPGHLPSSFGASEAGADHQNLQTFNRQLA
jgi:hypothetical protein